MWFDFSRFSRFIIGYYAQKVWAGIMWFKLLNYFCIWNYQFRIPRKHKNLNQMRNYNKKKEKKYHSITSCWIICFCIQNNLLCHFHIGRLVNINMANSIWKGKYSNFVTFMAIYIYINGKQLSGLKYPSLVCFFFNNWILSLNHKDKLTLV